MALRLCLFTNFSLKLPFQLKPICSSNISRPIMVHLIRLYSRIVQISRLTTLTSENATVSTRHTANTANIVITSFLFSLNANWWFINVLNWFKSQTMQSNKQRCGRVQHDQQCKRLVQSTFVPKEVYMQEIIRKTKKANKKSTVQRQ